MRRSAEAYLADVIDACGAIQAALDGISVDTYRASRLLRSAVEREFMIIGEALASFGRLVAPLRFECEALLSQMLASGQSD